MCYIKVNYFIQALYEYPTRSCLIKEDMIKILKNAEDLQLKANTEKLSDISTHNTFLITEPNKPL